MYSAALREGKTCPLGLSHLCITRPPPDIYSIDYKHQGPAPRGAKQALRYYEVIRESPDPLFTKVRLLAICSDRALLAENFVTGSVVYHGAYHGACPRDTNAAWVLVMFVGLTARGVRAFLC